MWFVYFVSCSISKVFTKGKGMIMQTTIFILTNDMEISPFRRKYHQLDLNNLFTRIYLYFGGYSTQTDGYIAEQTDISQNRRIYLYFDGYSTQTDGYIAE